MLRYCIAKIDMKRHTNFGETWFFARLKDGTLGWVESLLSGGIIWFDTAEEAKSNLLDDNECVIERAFVDRSEVEALESLPEFTIQQVAMEETFVSSSQASAKSDNDHAAIPIPRKGKGSKYDLILQSFIQGDKDTMCVLDYGDVCVGSAVRGLKRYATIMHYPVEVVNRNDRVYLVRRKPGEIQDSYQPATRQKRASPRRTLMVTMG